MVYSLGPKAPNSHKLPMVPHVYPSPFLFTPQQIWTQSIYMIYQPSSSMSTCSASCNSNICIYEGSIISQHHKPYLRAPPLPVLDDLPKDILHLAFFLVENDSEIPKIMDPTNAIPTSGNYVTSTMELEMYFGSIRHHSSGYTLVNPWITHRYI